MNQSTTTSRRNFLKAASLTTALFGAESALHAQETRRSVDNVGAPKKVIFMVSDGMNHGALSLAQHYLSHFKDSRTHWMSMYRDLPVVRGLVETFSANSLVTDSAAAASAWGGGVRVNNGSINVSPEGNLNKPLQAIFKEKNIPTGLVSTATITHATPAGFAANVADRSNEAEIARQYLDREVAVLLGGGRKFFPDDLRAKYAAAGYEQFKYRDDLMQANASSKAPVLGTFADGYMPYAIDREASETETQKRPTLKEMAEFAVKKLDAISKDRWFLMVEGARIDHCGHGNDAVGSIHEQIDFDHAIGAMLDYVSKHDDTLLIITTDHGTGGIQLNGMNSSPDQKMAPGIYSGTTACFERVEQFKHSLEWMRGKGAGLSGPPLHDFLLKETGLDLTKDEIKRAQGLKSGDVAPLFGAHHGIQWTSGDHTGDMIEFCAYGPGSHHFPAFIHNFEVHHFLLKAMELA
ncbi:alkaline phosphatase [Luteolibacter pohnpeiensis]|uniref:Alkaline phosphatase n=1 Tax=Luteolibacter pohnpeiensis TaxID=454153 RepID=A0A934VTV9_9BACT|nr:alkaline phosphatase [Luteolibacter pohnpeiensis]MBK1881887.1 alkaline phosphatase [Luteolibacter pohnpeiensis]